MASCNFFSDQSLQDRPHDVRPRLPVAEQYPSSTDTSAAGSSNRISHISITAMALKNAPPRESGQGTSPRKEDAGGENKVSCPEFPDNSI